MRKLLMGSLCFLMLISCSDSHQEELASFDVFCEMVNAGAKPIAFSHPMTLQDKEKLQSNFKKIADSYDVEIHWEDSLPDFGLFPKGIANNKHVAIIYTGTSLDRYHLLVQDLTKNPGNLLDISRSLGRLLGYDNISINRKLLENSDLSTIAHSRVLAQTSTFYYDDLQRAMDFYKSVIGLKLIESSDSSHLFRISSSTFLQLKATNDLHPSGQPKSVALALLTDQLTEWLEQLQQSDVPIKYGLKIRENNPHDGFVAIDPEGYLLEFEQFKSHRENENFIPNLNQSERIKTSKGLDFYGSITWTYHQDLLKMQYFYEDQLGFELVADQGWTKIYKTSLDGFIGLVDEKRGMNDYADAKAIELTWQVQNLQLLTKSAINFDFSGESRYQFEGPEKYIYHLTK